jgi:cyclin-dependent kinase regulatory subunit CKS1
MLKKIPADYFDASKGTLKLLWEEEWRALGITQVRYACQSSLTLLAADNSLHQSLGWVHYEW